jgi:hypothetical protein
MFWKNVDKSFGNVLKHGFKNHAYNDDDLGAPSNIIPVRENYPLDGATPMERLPLGGEGYKQV